MTNHSGPTIRAIDLFAGAGGSSLGAIRAGVKVVAAVDEWNLAEKTYLSNFDGVTFYRQKCETLSPRRVKREVGPVDLLIASPECTSHTCAKGKGKRSENSRKTAFQVVRFAKALRPRWIVVENVIHMRGWKRYEEWLAKLVSLGYNVRQQILNSADFGVPQARKRLFILCDLESRPPELHRAAAKRSPARQVINKNGIYRYSPLNNRRRASATLERATRAIRSLRRRSPFLIVYYGSDGAGGWQRLCRPLRTVTTVDRFAFVRPRRKRGYEMRMLQVPELQRAMGFPARYQFGDGTRRERIRLLGNAVCPPVMRAAIQALIGKPSRG